MNTSSAINNLNTSLQRFYSAASKVSDPNQSADANDIIEMKQAVADAEVGARILKKINETKRLVDLLA